MAFLSVPNEILIEIAEYLDNQRNIGAVSRVYRRLSQSHRIIICTANYSVFPLRLLGEGHQHVKASNTQIFSQPPRFLHPKATQHATQSQFY
jgi:hypothetical protein